MVSVDGGFVEMEEEGQRRVYLGARDSHRFIHINYNIWRAQKREP